MERINSGELTMGPTVARTRAFLKAAYPTPEAAITAIEDARGDEPFPASQPAPTLPQLRTIKFDFETEWEAYTRDFITRHQLNDEQAQKAWNICAACQEQARAYVASRRADFEELDQQMASARASGSLTDPPSMQKLESRREKLMQPVTRVFDERLKPRLDRIPTRKQRAAADGKKAP